MTVASLSGGTGEFSPEIHGPFEIECGDHLWSEAGGMDESPGKPVGNWFSSGPCLDGDTTRQPTKAFDDVSKPPALGTPLRTVGKTRRGFSIHLGIRPGPNTPDFTDFNYTGLVDAIDDPPMVSTNDQLAKTGQVSTERMPRVGFIKEYKNLLKYFGHDIGA